MALSETEVRRYLLRLLQARLRILTSHGFYGLLLMHMIYSIDEGADTAWTDGERIAFGPAFLDGLSEEELDFVLMHEILHVVLRHVARGEDRDQERWNVAADIVVNSNILLENGNRLRSITLRQWGESMHLAPDGKEGSLYTAEQVYDMLPASPPRNGRKAGRGSGDGEGGNARSDASGKLWDDHSRWGRVEADDGTEELWVKRFTDCCEAIRIREKTDGRGLLPGFAQRLLDKLTKPQLDWRTILEEFLQEETTDYSFTPPDRRFPDSPFFLPDLNEDTPDGTPENILFMIDTSASMSDREITVAFSEIKGAVEQFGGKLKGRLGFFDAAVIEPIPFEEVEDLLQIRPAGGGGTSFHAVFRYVAEKMQEEPPSCVILLTDGYAPFPPEEAAGGIPVLWLVTTVVEPPWGKLARLKAER